MSNLLSLKFWLAMRPGTLLPIYNKIFIIFIIFLIVLSLLCVFLKNKRKKSIYNKIWRSLSSFSLVNAFTGLILLFFTYEMVPLLSSRFWFIIWGAGAAVWLFFIARAAREIPKRKKQLEEEKQFKQYIP